MNDRNLKSNSKLNQSSRTGFPSIRLRALIVIPFVLQTFVAVGLTAWLSLRNGREAVNNVASQLRTEARNNIENQFNNYFEKLYALFDLVVADLANEQKYFDDLSSLDKFLLSLVNIAPSGLWQVGKPNGDFILYQKLEDGQNIVKFRDQSTAPNRLVYNLNSQGQRTDFIAKEKFDPRDRPWYKKAISDKKASWTQIFSLARSKKPALGVSLSQPLYRNANPTDLVAVISVTLDLENLTRVIKDKDLQITQNSQIFAIERETEDLLAGSKISQPFVINDDNKAIKIKASQSPDNLLQSVIKYLIKSSQGVRAISGIQQLDFDLDGKRQFIEVFPIKDQRGIDWIIVLVVPEDDFMETINQNTAFTILLCLLTLLATIGLGFFGSRLIVAPMQKLTTAAKAIAEGDLEQEVNSRGILEAEVLAKAFNQMSLQLKESFDVLEKKVADRTLALSQAKELADNANQAKSEFLANVSHELRTPLNGILGYTQILSRSKTISTKERQGIDIIHQCGSHLLTLINDILDLSKIEARKLEINSQAIHLQTFVQGVVEICRLRAEKKGVQLVVNLDDSLPEGIFVDDKRLRQVLINLIGNAIKFTDQGNVTFSIQNLSSQNVQNQIFSGFEQSAISTRVLLRFQVEDTGIGIDNLSQEKIFDAFEQVGHKKSQVEGTGLGLAISQRIISLMGSRIKVSSELGKGSTFSFELVCEITSNSEQKVLAKNVSQIVGYEGKIRRLLVVDDRWENRSVLVNLLTAIGFEVDEVGDGLEALTQIRQNSYDLIIADIVMPVMDGFELLTQIRNDIAIKDLVVIVSSASVSDTERLKTEEMGGNDFLAKPVDTDYLFELISKHLQLTWKYGETEKSPKFTKNQSSDLEIIAPPYEDLRILLELSQKGMFIKFTQHLDLISQKSDRYQPFIEKLTQMAMEFEGELIESTILKYLEIS
ncbi:MAG: ATP-binding protein [Pseudanabaena sp.]